jgi:aspartyl-tRNA(Asn)/glutamyl-tRNA(Gln) amidotransferase subunit C
LEQVTVAELKIDVAYVAELARLELTDEEKAVFQPQLESIVKYVEKISGVDVDGVEPMMHGRQLVNAFREDTVRPGMDSEAALANAPKRVGDEFLLPKIVEGAES